MPIPRTVPPRAYFMAGLLIVLVGLVLAAFATIGGVRLGGSILIMVWGGIALVAVGDAFLRLDRIIRLLEQRDRPD